MDANKKTGGLWPLSPMSGAETMSPFPVLHLNTVSHASSHPGSSREGGELTT